MNYPELSYSELSALLSQSSEKETLLGNISHLDRKAMYVVCALQAFPHYKSWWEGLPLEKRDNVFEIVKSALRDAHLLYARGPVKEAIQEG